VAFTNPRLIESVSLGYNQKQKEIEIKKMRRTKKNRKQMEKRVRRKVISRRW
jgi:hypothetical protein